MNTQVFWHNRGLTWSETINGHDDSYWSIKAAMGVDEADQSVWVGIFKDKLIGTYICSWWKSGRSEYVQYVKFLTHYQ